MYSVCIYIGTVRVHTYIRMYVHICPAHCIHVHVHVLVHTCTIKINYVSLKCARMWLLNNIHVPHNVERPLCN